MSNIKNAFLDIVIVNWNSGGQLEDCLASIEQFSDPRLATVTVVDNFSVDSSTDCVSPSEKLRLIKSSVNLGFGKACNLGAKNTSGEYLLFLNPDAVLFPETLTKVLNYMESSQGSEFAICGVKLINEISQIARSCSRFPTAKGFLAHSFGLGKLLPSTGHMMAEWDHSNTREVDHVIGAFFFVRRRVFNVLHGFDEKYFLYLEDVDFSLRARKNGYKTIFLSEAEAFHAGGGTSRSIKARRLFYSLRSRLTYASVHFSKAAMLLTGLATLLVEPISRSFFALSMFSWSGLKETWVAYGMLWRWVFFRR